MLDQSRFLAPIPDDQVRLALRAEGKPESTRVVGATARDLATRGKARIVVEGTIQRVGPRYSIILRAADSYRDSVLVTVGPEAVTEADLAKRLARLAERLCDRLADRPGQLRAGLWGKDRGAPVLITASFAAWRALDEAARLNSEGEVEQARRQIREALRLDPDYALAWRGLGINYWNLSMRDSAGWAFKQALKRKNRIPERHRLRLEAEMVDLEQGSEAAIPLYLEILKLDPKNVGALEVLAINYWELGRDEEALARVREAGRASPVGPYPNTYQLEVAILLSLGRTEEAAGIIDSRMTGRLQADARSSLAGAVNDWPAVEEAIGFESRLAGQSRNLMAYSGIARAHSRMARGAYRDGAHDLAEAVAFARDSDLPDEAFVAAVTFECIPLLTGSRQDPAKLPQRSEASAGNRIVEGFQALNRGNVDQASDWLDKSKLRPSAERAGLGSSPAILEAWIALEKARWSDVIAAAGLHARGIRKDLLFPPGRSLAGWLVGSAFESLGNADSAAYFYERALAPTGKSHDEIIARGIATPFLRYRLIRLYSRTGRSAMAIRHWESLRRELDSPDPGLRRLREDARKLIATSAATAHQQTSKTP